MTRSPRLRLVPIYCHGRSHSSVPVIPLATPSRGNRSLTKRLLFALTLLGFFATPLIIRAQTFVAEWTATAEGGVTPTGMALSTENSVTYLYVSDQPRGRVLKFNTATGAVALVIGKPGTANGDLSSPHGIARDPVSGDFYVAERANHRVTRFTSAGAFVMSWGTQGSAQGQFNEPIGVAVDATGDVYVTEFANHRVQKFRITQTGGIWSAANLAMWGTLGSGVGQFNQPYGVTADAAGNIWVADGLNGRVQRFNTSGVYLSTLGGPGTAAGQFVVPTSIAVGSTGEVFVTSTNSNPQNAALPDASNQWVTRFSAAGTVLSRWGGSFGTAPSQFRLPFSAVVGANNRVYVADHYNNRIQVFDLLAAPDATVPTVATFTTGATTATSVIFHVTFSEPVTGVDAADFATVTTGGATATIGTVTGVGTTYTIPVTFTGTGTVQLNLNATNTGIADTAANGIAVGATGPVYTIPVGGDTTPPTVLTFTSTGATATTVPYQITFSEPVTGVNSADFTTITTGGATATIGTVSGSGATYTIVVNYSGSGTVQLNLNASGTGITDAAMNPLAGGATGPVHSTVPGADTTPPTVASFTIGTTNPTTVNFLLSFSEPVTGVNSSDFSIVTTGGATATIGTVSGSGSLYTVPVSYSGPGTVQLNLNASGTGIVDAANNAMVAGMSGPLFTIVVGGVPPPPTQVVGVTVPPNGTYGKNAELLFVVRFNGNVTVIGDRKNTGKNNKSADDNDDDEAAVYFTWTAVPAAGLPIDSGKAQYVSGSGGSALTFRLKVHNGTMAPAGILLGNVIRVEDGATIRDANGVGIDASRLTLPWAQNPMTGLILDAPKPGNGNGGSGNNGNGKNKARNDRLVNLSSRLRVTGGDASRSVVVGFVVVGDAPKQVLIRAVGPGLAGFGVRDAIDQPVLTVRDSAGKTVAENDGWKNHPDISVAGDAVGAFRLNNGSRDAALLLPLPPGAYTAQVTANGNGLVLVEVYDTVNGALLSTEQIVNISTRGFVGTGDDVLVAGFVVTGSAPKRILIRGVGPALAAFGVPNLVVDPVLRVYPAGSSTPVAQNDNWETPQQIGSQPIATAAEITAASTAAGAFPLGAGGRDATVIVTLPAGNYSAVVSGANNGTGAGLVEIYELP